MVQIYGNKFIHPIGDHWLMAPEESMWNPNIREPTQCKLCQMWFHQDICGVCDQCYYEYKRWEYNQPSQYPGQLNEEVSGISLDVPEPSEECEEE